MTSIIEKNISICVIFIYLLFIKKISNNKESKCSYKTCRQDFPGKFTRQHIPNNWQSYHQLAYIVAIFGDIVYLFLVHGVVLLTKQFLYLEPDIAYFIDKLWVLLI